MAKRISNHLLPVQGGPKKKSVQNDKAQLQQASTIPFFFFFKLKLVPGLLQESK